MTDQNQALRDDIAFMRGLAEEGRAGPITGGPILIAAGLVYAAASLASAYAIHTGLAASNGLIFPEIWFGSAGVFFAVLSIFKLHQPARGGASRAIGLVWSGAGWSIFALVVSLMIIGGRTGAWSVMAAVGPMVLSIYGGCWMVAALFIRARWLYACAIGSFFAAGLNAWFATNWEAMFLVYAVSLLALLALPGWVLTRKARAQARADG